MPGGLDMRRRQSPYVVLLTEEEHKELNHWLRCTTMPAGLVRRARAILLVSEGKSLSETGRIVGMGRRMVRVWVSRFIAERIDGLYDQPGRGKKPAFSP
jgi:hypothetical protein